MKDRITGHTVLTGLLGSPVAHSISPMMHNESFRQLGLDYAYLAFDVGTDNLKTAVEGLKVLGVRGFNLTMPDKNLMCTYCDKLSVAIFPFFDNKILPYFPHLPFSIKPELCSEKLYTRIRFIFSQINVSPFVFSVPLHTVWQN